MDRFSIFKKEAKVRQEDPIQKPPRKNNNGYIIGLSVFLAGLLIVTGEGWFPPQLGLLFAFATIALIIGFVKFKQKNTDPK